MGTSRLTMAQALVRYLCRQFVEIDGNRVPLFGGVFAIFGHGNVAGLGEALHGVRELPTIRAHNEQAMAHAAIAYAKANFRRRMMACTTSIGPGATNMVTAAAVAHVNRLPVLFLPGDVFAGRGPDPVLQQVENFGDPTITANDCFRPVSRYFDRLERPEQLLSSLPAALRVLTDPAECGPVTLALPQDVQTEAFDYPEAFFEERIHRIRRPGPDPVELEAAVKLIASKKRPLVIAGGGVLYSGAAEALARFSERHAIPVAETQAGKGALPWRFENVVGGIGVTGSAAANALAKDADLVIAVGTRLQDFTTASWTLFENPEHHVLGLNVSPFDAAKRGSRPLVGDARTLVSALDEALGGFQSPKSWIEEARALKRSWNDVIDEATRPQGGARWTDAQVLGAVNRVAGTDGIVVGAAGGLPGELHKLWRAGGPGTYHLEYGYSCMGYEIAGAMGVKLARPEQEVFVLVGDGSYLMMNSEIASSVMHGLKLNIVVLDNHGFGCIHRLQEGTGGAPFNNLLADATGRAPAIDFAGHARALGAHAERVEAGGSLEDALLRARGQAHTSVIVVETDASLSTQAGGAWWDVAVPEVSERREVQAARARMAASRVRQRRV